MNSSIEDMVLAQVDDCVNNLDSLNQTTRRLKDHVPEEQYYSLSFRARVDAEYIEKCKQAICEHARGQFSHLDRQSTNEFLGGLYFTNTGVDPNIPVFNSCPYTHIFNQALSKREPHEVENILRDLRDMLRTKFYEFSSQQVQSNEETSKPMVLLLVEKYLLHYKSHFLLQPVTASNILQRPVFTDEWIAFAENNKDVAEILSVQHLDIFEELLVSVAEENDIINLCKPQIQLLCEQFQSELKVEVVFVNSRNVLCT